MSDEQKPPEGEPIDLPGGTALAGDGRAAGAMALWRRSYGASPAHLLLHLAGIAVAAWALSQSFDARYSATYGNLAVWMVGGAVLNDFVALPLYVGVDKAARLVWGLIRARRPGGPGDASRAVGPGLSEPTDRSDGPGNAGARDGRVVASPRLLGNGHVRVPLVVSAVLLLVYFPNIAHKAPLNHTLATGLAEQPDYAGRWLAITAGMLIVSGLLYLARLARARRRTVTTA